MYHEFVLNIKRRSLLILHVYSEGKVGWIEHQIKNIWILRNCSFGWFFLSLSRLNRMYFCPYLFPSVDICYSGKVSKFSEDIVDKIESFFLHSLSKESLVLLSTLSSFYRKRRRIETTKSIRIPRWWTLEQSPTPNHSPQ